MGMLNADKKPQITCGKSRTQQHLHDLNSPRRLIEKYGANRLKQALAANPSMFSDVPPTRDYKEALDLIAQADRSFSNLPSKIRNRFENDPVKLIAFLNDSKNRDEAVTLGLINPPTVTDEAKRKEVKKVDDETAKKAPKSDDK